MLQDIRPEQFAQRDLLAPRPENSTRLMKVMDGVNQHFGSGVIKLARQGGESGFAMKRTMKSPSYLTRWHEIPPIKLSVSFRAEALLFRCALKCVVHTQDVPPLWWDRYIPLHWAGRVRVNSRPGSSLYSESREQPW